MSKRMEGVTTTQRLQPDMEIGEAVIFAVAEAEGVSPMNLSPLTNAIDPDALNNFVTSLSAKQDDTTGFVEFEYRDHTITVTADGTVTVG